jgi:dihydrofolate reductase
MKVILWMAMSVNGIIARENNEEDFISDDSWNAWIGYAQKVGTIVWGRKAYEIVKSWGKKYIDDLKNIQKIVVTSDPNYKVEEGFEIASSPQEVIERLEKEGINEIILTGGSTLNSSFAKLNLIDEIILNIEPVIIGKGIPLFRPEVFDLKLEFIEIDKYQGKTTQLHYKVLK